MRGMDQASAFALWHEASLKAMAHRLLRSPAVAHRDGQEGGAHPAPLPSIVLQVFSPAQVPRSRPRPRPARCRAAAKLVPMATSALCIAWMDLTCHVCNSGMLRVGAAGCGNLRLPASCLVRLHPDSHRQNCKC